MVFLAVSHKGGRYGWLLTPLYILCLCPPALHPAKLFTIRGTATTTRQELQHQGVPRGPADMPLLKTIRSAGPLWRDWDRKAQKSGLRSTVYTVNGGEYTGEWMNNLRHGKGSYVYKKANAIYQGDWICGKRSGYGTYAVKAPSTGQYIRVYAGNWLNDKKHGYGTYYYSEDEYYEGGWECEKRSGWGKMIYANGDIYEGEWLNDKYCGRGILFLANKNRYEGSWKDGKKHGPGKFHYLDTGRIYDGYWIKNVPKCGTLEDIGCTEAPTTKKLPIPEVKVADPKRVCEEARRALLQKKKVHFILP